MKVLVISAHPDDETLGCGGTLLRHKACGDSIHWLIMTIPHGVNWTPTTVSAKAKEVEDVSKAYGMESVIRCPFTSTECDVVKHSKIITRLRDEIAAIRPQIIYVVHGGDVHTDHRIVHSALASAVKMFEMRDFGIQKILSYETLSSTEAGMANPATAFVPQVFCDISNYLEEKLVMMSMYKTEEHFEYFPRNGDAIRALARYRGATIGAEYAEAFTLLREIC